uniref:ATP-dependent DNA helicase n=1 Tax=Meloidogyne incognita TaxID=6306 RepID=A0A914N5G3_MELIC
MKMCILKSQLIVAGLINFIHVQMLGQNIMSLISIPVILVTKCGVVELPPFSPHPQLLKDLSKGDSEDSLEFLQHQNIYNSLLAFASVYVGHKESNLDGGICFLLNGEFVRKLSSITPGSNGPSFSQLYILDAKTAFDNRVNNVAYGGDRVNQETLKKLDILLRETHPLANAYKNFHTQYLEKLQTEGLDSVKHFRLVLLEARDAPVIIRDSSDHPRQLNLPTEETLFSICTEADELPEVKGIYITDLEGHLFTFRPNHPLTDPLTYPILFPCGDDGYHDKLLVNKKNLTKLGTISSDNDNEVEDDAKKISPRDYVKYRLAVRKDEEYHNIWNSGGGLSQKYVLDYNARVDSNVANYLRKPDMDLRATYPPDALRWLQRDCGAKSVEDLGHIVMFRKYHPGTRPYFQEMFYNATTIMARTRKSGFCSFMFTFTCNPNWPEIKRNLLRDNQKIVDRFDIICRIYEDKLRKLHTLLEKKHILGKILGSAESREFQKRIGGPHLHRVYCTDIPATPENVENLIWAHIPKEPPANDKSVWANFLRKVRELLPKHQFHDCGAHCRNSRGKCKKGFPKPFSKFTILHDDKPAEYKRPSPEDGGETLTLPRGRAKITYNNSHVVAYNPFILVMFRTHHNLEYAYGQSDNLKYALKYPFKGASFSYVRSSIDGRIDVDEPAQYAKMIYRSPSEGYSRSMGYKYAFLSHTVIALKIHLPDNQKLYFNSRTAPTILANAEEGILPDTHLTAYWKLWRKNINDPVIRNILFEELPETYSFDIKEKVWRKRRMAVVRKITKPIIGRIYTVSPREPEKFALYVLTKHFPGDPEELKNVNGQICTTFADAARLRGLFEDNGVWERTLREASLSLNPSQMRQLYANILVFGGTEKCVIDGLNLWEMFKDQMYDRRRCTEDEKLLRIDRALAIIERYLLSNGRTMYEFDLPAPNNPLINDPDRALDQFFFPNNVNSDEVDETVDTSALEKANLNAEQDNFFKMVRNAAFDPNSVNKYFYLSGDGGTGKTFLLNYVLYQLRSLNLKVLPTASTGIASTKFYAGGMTFHSAFRFGIDVEPGKIPPVRVDSFFGRRIIECDVIIIDEITMLDKVVFENVDKLCRTLVPQNNNRPFAGKVVILSGDWKQSLPVVQDSASPGASVAASILSSSLYGRFQKFRLVQNMRVIPSEIVFKDWLYSIGTGTIGDLVNIPQNMIVNSRKELYEFVFDQGFKVSSNELLKRLILAPTNRIVDDINSEIIDMIDSPVFEYLSIDNATIENPLACNSSDYEVAQLNRLNPIGMPAHSLKLKIGSVIVLLQNLNTQKSLCNGTRLIVKNLRSNLIEAETINSGSDNGILVGICRTRNLYNEKRPDGVSFERFQFPVRVAFCMTITKAQGQTCERLGIDFNDEPFAHGQLYTALSRARSSEFIRVYAPNKKTDDNGNIPIRNVVANGITFD